MVWEQTPALILMAEEENEVCPQVMNAHFQCQNNKQTIDYWPDTRETVHQKYGLITVTVRKRIAEPDYTVTTFRLSQSTVSTLSY